MNGDESDPEKPGSAAETTFDALIERMKHDISTEENAQTRTGAAARLGEVIEAALHEAGGKAAHVAEQVHDASEKVKTEMRSHPTATISGAFAAGYFIGKAIAGRARK